ncbi:hypothetical protein CVU82_03915 [Candidatus Falkowbacteria bacterium HGW-Falkowbacteria-1]|jgi:amino acid transporter|uniref:DUF4190 domain-containing protein n=1 Tax=Candidatus Falkowbacteria bacterium HGW-Falkowbacteria-1 TaxID=2013768 RepID=A0A2N2E8Y7_9BACT|nr:MAG: hypothetical protein CVU82_03915 [Candidatus Falkowbacteria bacterium HGW-Falkowbacteria-1]
MKNHKNVKFIIPLLFLFCFFVQNVFASGNLSSAFKPSKVGWSASKMGFNVSANTQSVEGVVGIVISAILSFLGIIFLAYVIYGGVLWMTASGNDQQVEKAQRIIKHATVGVLVVLISYGLSWLILNIFVNQGLTLPN